MTEENPKSAECNKSEDKRDSLRSEAYAAYPVSERMSSSELTNTDSQKIEEGLGFQVPVERQPTLNDGRNARTGLSQRRLSANRANARKSIGPKSARGKAWSRKNSLRHGLTASAVWFDLNGVPSDPEIKQLLNCLKDQFADDSQDTEALLNQVAIECTRQLHVLELENRVFAGGGVENSEITLSNLRRYQNKNRRVLLEKLQKLRASKRND